MSKYQQAEIPFEQVLAALRDIDKPLHPRYLYRLSDLESGEQKQLQQAWPEIPLWRRQALMEDIGELASSDTLTYFLGLGLVAVDDQDPKVRLLAVQTLSEYVDRSLAPILIQLVRNDPNYLVRAAAVKSLAGYIYEGEIELLPRRILTQVEQVLLEVVDGKDTAAVRQSALEALGFSSRKEIPVLINTAFASGDKDWMASALFAMGRSANQQWRPQVIEMLSDPTPSLRQEAARAAGELDLQETVPQLIDLLEDPDEDIRMASIWSLSQLGGEGVREILENLLEQSEDESEQDYLETALDNLEFTEEIQLMPLLDIPEDLEDDELDSDFKTLEDEDQA